MINGTMEKLIGLERIETLIGRIRFKEKKGNGITSSMTMGHCSDRWIVNAESIPYSPSVVVTVP